MATTITANDEPTEIEADVDKRFSSIIVNLPVQQTGTGTPSPSNPRPFAKWTDVSLYVSDAETANEPTLTITLPTPMYGGKVDMVRGEIATMYNSKESGTDWEMTEEGQFRCQVSAYNNGDETSTNVADLYAVHYETVSNKDAYDATDDLTCGLATIDGTTYLYVNDAQYTTLESFATHIADEVFVFRAHIPMSDVTEPHIVYLPEGTSYVWAEGAYYVEIVTGTPPLSLHNSVGKPLESWEVTLSPYQDLHGYDNPWPAGGGMNKFGPNESPTAEAFIKANGDMVTGSSATNWIISDYIPVLAETQYTFNPNTTSGVAAYFAYYDETKTLISTIASSTTTFMTPADCAFMRFSYRDSSYDIQLELGSSVSATYSPYSNICPILGTDKVTAWTSGKNLIDIPDKTTASEGYIFNDSFDFLPGQYVLSYYSTTPTNLGAIVAVGKDDVNCSVSLARDNSRIVATINAPKGIKSIRVYNGPATYTNIQLELGSTASDYTPYVAPSQTVIDVPTLSANKWDEEWESGDISADTGENEQNGNLIRTKNYIPIIAGAQYYAKIGSIESTTNLRARFYDVNKTYIGYYTAQETVVKCNSVFTAPENAAYMRFATPTTYGTTYLHDISINYPSTVTTYNPFSNTIYGGTLDLATGDGTIDRASVDLGTLSWLYRGEIGTGIFSTSGITDYVRNKLNIFAMCETYKNIGGVGGVRDMIGNPNAIGFYTERSVSAVYVVDERFTDATAFTSAVSGIKLVYELATPTPFTTDGHTIKLPKGNAYTWATAEDGTVDSLKVQYIRIAEQEA